MDSNHDNTNVNRTSKKAASRKTVWDTSTHITFVELCLEEVKKGNRPGTHFNKIGWTNLENNLKARSGKVFNKQQLKNHWDTMKKDFKLYDRLMRIESGLGWDPVKKTIDATPEWWDEKIEADPDLAKFRDKNLEMYHMYYEQLFRDSVAVGDKTQLPIQFQNNDSPSNNQEEDLGAEIWKGIGSPNDIWFNKLKPLAFRSAATPAEAEDWITHMEKLFQVLGCPDNFKTRLAAFKLEGDALSWWKAHLVLGWSDAFAILYLGCFSCDLVPYRYCPSSEQQRYEREYGSICQLDRENSGEYMKRFTRLASFVGTAAGDTQRQELDHFKWGLKKWSGNSNKRDRDGNRIQNRGQGQQENKGRYDQGFMLQVFEVRGRVTVTLPPPTSLSYCEGLSPSESRWQNMPSDFARLPYTGRVYATTSDQLARLQLMRMGEKFVWFGMMRQESFKELNDDWCVLDIGLLPSGSGGFQYTVMHRRKVWAVCGGFCIEDLETLSVDQESSKGRRGVVGIVQKVVDGKHTGSVLDDEVLCGLKIGLFNQDVQRFESVTFGVGNGMKQALLEIPMRKWDEISLGFSLMVLQKAWGGTRLSFVVTSFHPPNDGQSERTIQTLEDMLRACALEWTGSWDEYLCLVEFAYNNSTSGILHLGKHLSSFDLVE
ncbi:zinc finger, CCHC-type, retrotransposon gag domain protein [Tanacetum coccineum]